MNELPRKREAEPQGRTPAWIVSFTDMITLLLAFFIMLQALATKRDPDLFFKGQGAFRRAISGLGFPDWLLGQHEKIDLKHTRIKHPMEEDPEDASRQRVIDTEDEKIRKVYEDLRQLVEADATDYDGSPARVLATPITFERDDATLGEPAREFLLNLVSYLKQQTGGRAPSLQVIGLAPDETDPENRWLLSACVRQGRRHLPRRVPRRRNEAPGARVESWGAGPGSRWGRTVGRMPQQVFILIGLMDAPSKE